MGDGQKATNEAARGLQSHNIVLDWLSHWFHVAVIKHKGGFQGAPSTCKGLFDHECPRMAMERKRDAEAGGYVETPEKFAERHADSRNGSMRFQHRDYDSGSER